jgi:hypothetical protein
MQPQQIKTSMAFQSDETAINGRYLCSPRGLWI